MNSKTTISITEARKKFFKIVNEVSESGQYYTLTEKGKPKAVILSVEEFESWIETFEVMKEMPDLDKDIEKVRKDIKSGEYLNYPTLDDLFLKKDFVVADKKNKYVLSNPIRTKNNK